MSWLVLATGVLTPVAFAEEGEATSEEAPAGLEDIEEKIRVTEALIRLAEAEARLAEMDSEAAPNVDTEEAEATPVKAAPAPEPAEETVEEAPEEASEEPAEIVEEIEEELVVAEERVVQQVLVEGNTRVGGELRFGLLADRLDNLHPEVSEDPSLAFVIPRARAHIDHSFGERASAKLQIALSEDHDSTTYVGSDGGSVTVPDSNTGVAVALHDVYFRYETPMGGTFRIGSAKRTFGLIDSYESDFDLPSPVVAPPQVGEGMLSYRAAGLMWSRAVGDKMHADLSLTNSSTPEREIPKDLTLRLSATPVEAMTVSASVLAGPGSGGATKVGYQGMLFVHSGPNRALVEVYGLQGAGPTSLGAAGHLARDFELSSEAMSRVTPIARVSWFDPDQGTSVDHHTAVALAVETAWSDSGVSTALAYEVDVPDDVDLAIEHRAVFECKLRF